MANMASDRIAQLIAADLPAGLTHPGNEETGQPETIINLPAFRTTGMPDEVAKQVSITVKLLGEAIVHTIEAKGQCEIVPAEEISRLRNLEARVGGAGTRMVPLHCRCDPGRSNPLAVLTITDSPAIVVDGKQLITGLSKRRPECPHGMK